MLEIDEWDWYESFVECKSWTVCTKLRSFYYQLRVNDIMTNSKLVKMKIKTDPSCEWCDETNQTIVHLFWDCPVVHTLWNKISEWLSSKLNNNLEIKKELVFLYDIEAGNFTTIINLIILRITRYVYVCHCINKLPNFNGAIMKIKELEMVEKCIAEKNNTLYKHNKKWRVIYG